MRPTRGKTSADGRGVGPSWAALMDVRWPESLGSRFVSGTTPTRSNQSGGGYRACPIAASAVRAIRAPLRRNGDPIMTATTLHQGLPASIPNVVRVPSEARVDGEPSLIIVVSPGASPDDLDHIVARIEETGRQAHLSVGTERSHHRRHRPGRPRAPGHVRDAAPRRVRASRHQAVQARQPRVPAPRTPSSMLATA